MYKYERVALFHELCKDMKHVVSRPARNAHDKSQLVPENVTVEQTASRKNDNRPGKWASEWQEGGVGMGVGVGRPVADCASACNSPSLHTFRH